MHRGTIFLLTILIFSSRVAPSHWRSCAGRNGASAAASAAQQSSATPDHLDNHDAASVPANADAVVRRPESFAADVCLQVLAMEGPNADEGMSTSVSCSLITSGPWNCLFCRIPKKQRRKNATGKFRMPNFKSHFLNPGLANVFFLNYRIFFIGLSSFSRIQNHAILRPDADAIHFNNVSYAAATITKRAELHETVARVSFSNDYSTGKHRRGGSAPWRPPGFKAAVAGRSRPHANGTRAASKGMAAE